MVLKYKQACIFWNGKERFFKLKTENRDTELKILTEWISGQLGEGVVGETCHDWTTKGLNGTAPVSYCPRTWSCLSHICEPQSFSRPREPSTCPSRCFLNLPRGMGEPFWTWNQQALLNRLPSTVSCPKCKVIFACWTFEYTLTLRSCVAFEVPKLSEFFFQCHNYPRFPFLRTPTRSLYLTPRIQRIEYNIMTLLKTW